VYSNLRDAKMRLVLVHSGPHLLPEIGQKLGDYAQRVLEKRGMEIILNARAAEVTACKVILADRSFIETNTVICSVGSAPSPVLLDLCQQLGIGAPKGRISVEQTMRVVGQTHLWAAGDCAVVPWDDRGDLKPSPPTAQFAVRQGRQLGRNLAWVLRGAEPRPFRYRYMGQLATVGEREAVAEVFGFHFSGFFAWWMWRTIYLAKLPGVLRRLRVMIDWTFDLFFRRDISVVLPPPEDVLRSIHLEAGEALFHRGERPRAFFYIQRGCVRLNSEACDAQPEIEAATGGILDQRWVSEGRWRCSAYATESTDVIVFRGRALKLLQTALRLVPLEEARAEEKPKQPSGVTV
jgi:NADH dehydrogenase